MLNILLCDDDSFFLSLESSIVRDIIREDRLVGSVCAVAKNAEEALSFVKSAPSCLVFLDLDFGRDLPSGIDLGLAMRQKADDVRLVFTTNHREMAMNVLKSGVEPFGFLEKGSDLTSLTAGLRRYIRMAQSAAKHAAGGATVSLSFGGERVELSLDDIVYLESEKNISHGITYHTHSGSKITVISTLDTEAARLGEDFIRVHRSYLVSKNKILALRDGYLTLSNGDSVPASLKMRAEVKIWLAQRH